MMLRPHFALASARIHDVIARRAGGYAVATDTGIELFDDALAPAGRIAAKTYGKLAELTDGRFVMHAPGLFVVTADRAEQPEIGDFLQSIVITGDGFFAFGAACLVVDRAGARTRVELPRDRTNGGSAARRDGVAVAGIAGLTLLDVAGAELARSEAIYLTKAPMIVGDVIAVPGLPAAIHLFDDGARKIGEIAIEVGDRGARTFARGLLAHAADGFVVYLEPDTGAWAERWRVPMPESGDMFVAGEHVVIVGSTSASIVDVAGNVRYTHETPWLRAAVPFAGGIALVGDGVAWWRDGEPVVELAHDTPPQVIRDVPAGLVTTEDNVLFVWRTDAQGPEIANVTTDMPLGQPIVVDGQLLVIERTARFSILARTIHGMSVSLRPGTHTWRPVATREEAMQVAERLIGRVFDGPMAVVPAGDDARRTLAQLPIADTVELQGRAMYAASSLEGPVLERAAWARGAFFDELATVLATKPRLLAAAIRARKLRLDPPRPAPGHDYLGTFTTSGALTVSDPAYVGRKNPPGAFSLSLKIKAVEGLWHVFVRPAAKDPNRNAELAVVHEDAYTTSASEPAGTIAVDSGCAGVFDRACPKRDDNMPVEEGVLGGLGALAWSGYGDGGYPVFIGRTAGKVTKIRISFIDDQPEIDRLIASSSAAKPYSATAKFVVGEAIEHVKFGRGSVIRIEDGKIHVRFADATRTLVHGRR